MTEPAMKDSRPLDPQLLQVLKGILGLLLFAAVWFAIAGRLTWWQGWAVVLTFGTYVILIYWRLGKQNPELLRERNLPASSAEAWDRVVMAVYTVFLVVLLLVTALDGGRYHWSSIPLGLQAVGWLLLIAAGLMIWHVMTTNPYLSSWARLQPDRGQVVVQEGAYGHIRHPMYLGIIVAFLAMPLVLCSWWAMIPGMLNVGSFVYRTYREDRMLLRRLPGYAEYVERVRYRLLPKIW